MFENIKLNVRNVLSAVVVLFLSTVITITLMVVNDKMFLQDLRTEYVYENLNNIGRHIEKAPEKPINVKIQWPIQSIIFFYSLLCLYWYLAGNLCLRLFSVNAYWFGIGIAVVTSLLFLDLAMPLYALSLVVGIKWPLLNHQSGKSLTEE